MITINDIDVFILSYNRAKYIKTMINSLINQTVEEFEIKILDNGSSDNTKKVIEDFNRKSIKFIGSSQNKGALWNFQRAQNMASKKYTIIFHDDDLVHPNYLRYMLKALNEFQGVSIVCSGMKATSSPETKKFRKYNYNPIIYRSVSKFASLIYLGFPLNYATVAYKTTLLKKIDMKKLSDIYGKIADRPMVFQVAKKGSIVLFHGQYIQYRVHNYQDSNNSKTGPFYHQTIELHKKYKELIFKNGNFANKIYFLVNYYRYLKNEYSRFYQAPYTFDKYTKLANKKVKINNKFFIISKMLYYIKAYLIYKFYRWITRKIGEYS